jgi:SAM-dependent methyltransferase
MRLDDQIITDLCLKAFFSRKESLCRRYLYIFMERYGNQFSGRLVELGGHKTDGHARFFPNAVSYLYSNVGIGPDEYVDVTSMPYDDRSQDGFVCVSVLEHVYDIQGAFREINRTLKPGGQLMLFVPFVFAVHGDVDYWRMARTSYDRLLQDYEVEAFAHLGGLISTMLNALQRPKGNYKRRYLVYKLIGLLILLTCKRLDTLDSFPMGYCVYARKKTNLERQD